MSRPFVSLTSDFGVQTQGVGLMEAAVREIAQEAHVIHLMHGLPSFDTLAAARTMETTIQLPRGAHVCVCDPGVGSSRKAIIIETDRDDFLIGPDNGVLIPAARMLGGIARVHEITNESYMRLPVSPIFHGRDIFAPAAGHLAMGVPISNFGPALQAKNLVAAAYEEATIIGRKIHARIIQINKFGTLHLNIRQDTWDTFGVTLGMNVTLMAKQTPVLSLPFGRIFSDVAAESSVVLKDDYARISVAKNLGSFAEQYGFKIGDHVTLDMGPPQESPA